MSRILKGKKRFALGVLASLVIATAAFAYWTTLGDGDGDADVANAATGTITLAGTIVDTDFRPGHTSDITIAATNTDLETDLRVQNTTLSNITTDDAGCLPAWFSSSATPVAQDQTIEANTTEDLGVVHEITFNNVDVDQDACKGAEVSFDLSSD